jgi:CHAD domain-containing protein
MTDDTPSKGKSPLAKHLSACVERRLQKLLRSQKLLQSERSVDAVHDLRVASRRLRAFAVTFSEVLGDKLYARLEKRLKRVTKAVGALRDLDVLVALVEGRIAAAGGELERAALEHLAEALDERRSVAASKAEARLRALDTAVLSRLVRRAAEGVATQLSPDEGQRAYARTLLERLIQDAAEQTPASDRAADGRAADDPAEFDGAEYVEQLHRLRIDIKEIRYALELFEPLLGSHFAVLHERAAALQELLGTHHDLTVLGQIVGERSEALASKNRPALSAGLQLTADALRAERQTVVERFQSRGFEHEWWRDQLRAALEPG